VTKSERKRAGGPLLRDVELEEAQAAHEPGPRTPDGLARHHFTVDLEEYFHPSAMEPWIPRSQWSSLKRRSRELVPPLLDAMDRQDVRGTFFVLGWLAEREPETVRRIASRGHEIASHSWDHERVMRQKPKEFRSSVRRTKAVLEGLTGRPVLGFRAPSFSIIPGMEWALDILLEEGYAYDSSLFPVRLHPGYGYPTRSPDPHWIRRPSGMIAEIPMTTVKVGRIHIPASGGAYFRFFPYALVRAGLRGADRRGAPGMFYIHPWELDPAMPRLPASWLTRLRMRGGIRAARKRLRQLMSDFEFQPVARTLEAMQQRFSRDGTEGETP